jgi:signal peptidase I
VKDQSVAAVAAEKSGKKESIVWEYTKSIFIAVVLALVIRTFMVQAFAIPSGSMEATLAIGDRILVNKFLYGTNIPFADGRILKFREPVRGDVVVFEYPEDRSKDFIKRVIGIPGDQIQIINKKVHVNGRIYENPHEMHKDSEVIPGILSPRDNTDVITVPVNSYFVMGDNRDSSYDSRFWGFVESKDIKGLAFMKYWSWDPEKWRVRWKNIGRLID